MANTGKCRSYADFFTEEIKIMQISSSLKDISESFFNLFFPLYVYLAALSLSRLHARSAFICSMSSLVLTGNQTWASPLGVQS